MTRQYSRLHQRTLGVESERLEDKTLLSAFWQDDFEGTSPEMAASGSNRNALLHDSSTDGEKAGGDGDYSFRTFPDTTDANTDLMGGTPTMSTFTGHSGSKIWRGEDTDDGALSIQDGSGLVTMEWTDIDISGRSNLIFGGLFGAESGSSHNSNSLMQIQANVDSNGYNTILQFTVPSGGNQFHEGATGAGDALTELMAEFTSTAISFGNSLDLRIQWRGQGGGDEFAFDNFRIGDNNDPSVAAGDTTPPTVTSIARQTPSTSPTNADSLTFRVMFDEDVQNVTAGDFAVTGPAGAMIGVSAVTADVYDVTVSDGDLAALDATVDLNIANGNDIQDLAGNNLGNSPTIGSEETYVVENTAPTTTSFTRKTPADENTNADTLTFLATFSEDVTGVDASDFAVTGPTGASIAVSQVTANTYDVMISGGNLPTLDGTVALNFSSPSIADLAGNPLPGTEPGTDETYVVDNTGPAQSANTGLTAYEGQVASQIGQSSLAFLDATSGASDVTYKLDSVPANGTLYIDTNGNDEPDGVDEILAAAETFTQADINTGLLKYDHDGGDATSESFQFDLTDALGNETHDQEFSITVSPADTEIMLVGGLLTITDVEGGSSADQLSISHSSGTYTITDAGGLIIDASSISGSTGNGSSSVTVPDTGVTAITFDVLGGDDSVTVASLKTSTNLTITGGDGTDTASLNAPGLSVGVLQLAAETITQSQGVIVSGTVSFTAGASGTITLSQSSNDFQGDVTIVSAGATTLVDANALTLADSGTSGTTSITAGTSLALNNLNAAGQAVTLTATAGAITDANGDTSNLSASSLAASATAGVGTDANAIETELAALEAAGGSGGVNVSNSGDLTVGGVSGSLTGVSATGGNITVVASSPLTVNEDVVNSGGGNIELTAAASAAAGGLLYLADDGTNAVRVLDLSTNTATDLITGQAGVSDVAVDTMNDKIYWVDFTANALRRADLDGNNVEDLVTGLTTPRSVALDVAGGKVYWSDSGPNTDFDGGESIKRANLNGSSVETIVNSAALNDDPFGISLDLVNGHIYWMQKRTSQVIRRADLDGGNVTNILAGADGNTDIAVDGTNGYIYFTTESGATQGIERVDLNGSNRTLITTAPGTARALALDAAGGVLYFDDDDVVGAIKSDSVSGGAAATITTLAGANYRGLDFVTGSGTSSTDDLTINASVAVSGGNGTVTLNAADDVLQTSGTVSTAGAGSLIINASTDTNNGVLTMSAGTALSTASGAIATTSAGTATLDSVMSASGNITVTAGDVILNDSVSSSGGFLTLQPANANTTVGIGGGSGDFNVSDTELGRLTDGFGSITIGDAATGTGAIDVNSSTFSDTLEIVGGSIAVTGLNAGSNDVTLAARTGNITDGGSALDVTAGNLMLNAETGEIGQASSPGWLEISAATVTTDTTDGSNNGNQYLGVISGSVELKSIDAGTGTVSLHDDGEFKLTDNAIADATSVTVSVNSFDLNNATDAFAGLTIKSGATLKGEGTLTAPLTVEDGGMVVPGSSPGVISTGNLTLQSGSATTVEIDGDAGAGATDGHDQIMVSGTVDVTGATLTVDTSDLDSTEVVTGGEFVIIDNDGTDAVTGEFDGLAEGDTIAVNVAGSDYDLGITYRGGTTDNDIAIFVLPPTGIAVDASGNLVISSTVADDLTLTLDAGNGEYVLTSVNDVIITEIAGATGSGTMTVRIPTVVVTGTRIIINGGDGDDSLTVDYSGGAFGKTIEFNGGEIGETNGDVLYIRGDGGTTVESGVYTPDATTFGKGIHTLTLTAAAGGGTETIEFDELEPTEVSAIPTYTLTTPGSVDVLNVAATTAMGGQDALLVTGTSDGVMIESLTLFDVTSFKIDAATNDAGDTGNDSITISGGLDDGVDIARNLSDITIDAGSAGTGDADTVTVSSIIDVPGSVTIDNADSVDVDFDIEAGTSLTISNVDTEIDLAQDVDLTAADGDIALATGVTLIDLSGAAGTNRFVANDSPATGDGNISLGPISDTGTPSALEIDADNAVAVDNVDVQSTISIVANQDASGAEGFSQATGTSVSTTNDTASAISITVNSLVGGTGGAALEGISAGTTSGSTGGRVTVATSMGAITDANGAMVNITAGNTILSGMTGAGTAGDLLETAVSRLEASGGTGGVFVENSLDVTVGGINGTQVGVMSTDGDIVVCVNGSLMVSENVASTGSGSVTLKTVDTMAGFENLNLTTGQTISSGTGNVALQSGDGITLATGSNVTATGGAISVESDFGDVDPGVGTSIIIGAEFDSTGTTVTSGGDDDTVTITFPDGAMNSGTVTLSDSGGTDAVIINGTANDDTLFLTTEDPPTTATTEQVTRGNATDEPIVIPSDFDSLRLNGLDGLDTFDIQPSMLFPVTLDGGSPSFGQTGVPPGDTLDLDPFGNSFFLTGKTLFVNGGSPDDYEGITLINIENAPLDPLSNTTLRLDLNNEYSDGSQSPTAAGWTGVGSGALYAHGNGYGWQTPILKGRNDVDFYSSQYGDLIGDSHILAPEDQGGSHTFTADLAEPGFVLVTVGYGYAGYGLRGFQIEDGDSGQVLASGLTTQTLGLDHVSFILQVPDTTLDLVFRSLSGRYQTIALTSIDIAPGNLFSMGFAAPSTPLDADGTTVDTFTLASAPENALITVETDLGTLINSDADPDIEGIQVLTDGNGEAAIMLQRPTGAGQAVVLFSSAAGQEIGCSVVEYGLTETRFFDFDSPVGDNLVTETGYTAVMHTDMYSSSRGHGWLNSPFAHRNSRITPSALSSLNVDGHRHWETGTFRVDLPNGTYEVHAWFHDGGDHYGLQVSANGSIVLPSFTLASNEIVEATFDVTISGGRLELAIEQLRERRTDPYWTINGLEIRPTTTVGSFTPTNVGAVDADNSSSTTLTAATAAPDGTFVTVTSSLGTLTSADAASDIAGIQVVVSGGQVQFDLVHGAQSGTPTIEWRSVDGGYRTTVTDAAFLDFVIPVTRRFDFDVKISGSPLATQAGFTSVQTADRTPDVDGFGWTSWLGSIYPITGDVPGVVSDDLFRDGVNSAGTFDRTFQVVAKAGTDYDVRVYLGASGSLEVSAEGVGTQTIDPDGYTSLVLFNASDVDMDGLIDISFDNSPGVHSRWFAHGLEIAESATGLPAISSLRASETNGTGAVAITTNDLESLAAIVTTAFEQHLSLTTQQRNALETVQITIRDLSGGRLGYFSSRPETGLLRIVLDDDGAGYGWSSSSNSVEDGRYDLLTALAHELGHAVGYSHEQAVGSDDILSEILPLGTRRTSFAGIDDFFADTLSAGTAME